MQTMEGGGVGGRGSGVVGDWGVGAACGGGEMGAAAGVGFGVGVGAGARRRGQIRRRKRRSLLNAMVAVCRVDM